MNGQIKQFAEKYFPSKLVNKIMLLTEELIMLYPPPLKLALDYEEKNNRLKMSLESPEELLHPLEHPGTDEISRALITGIAENFTVEKTAGTTGTTLSMDIKNKIS
jgi:hypothetical protein